MPKHSNKRKRPISKDERISINSEKALIESLETIQADINKINSAVINAKAFFYHYKHAQERIKQAQKS